ADATRPVLPCDLLGRGPLSPAHPATIGVKGGRRARRGIGPLVQSSNHNPAHLRRSLISVIDPDLAEGGRELPQSSSQRLSPFGPPPAASNEIANFSGQVV